MTSTAAHTVTVTDLGEGMAMAPAFGKPLRFQMTCSCGQGWRTVSEKAAKARGQKHLDRVTRA